MTAMLFTDLVTYDAADRRATHRAGGAAAGQDSATHSADTSTDGGISILPRHVGTTTQAAQQNYGCHVYC
jgi:hypothetical protein